MTNQLQKDLDTIYDKKVALEEAIEKLIQEAERELMELKNVGNISINVDSKRSIGYLDSDGSIGYNSKRVNRVKLWACTELL